jgi:hypothetical protein
MHWYIIVDEVGFKETISFPELNHVGGWHSEARPQNGGAGSSAGHEIAPFNSAQLSKTITRLWREQ